MSIIIALIIFSLIILFHELGHFLLAKFNGVTVLEFSLGMGPRILSKSVWARISVIAAGPIFNFIMAFLASVVVIAMAGYDPAEVYKVYEDYPAAEAGIQAGDIITKINGKNIHVAREVTNYVAFHQGETYTVTYERDGESHVAVVEPVQNENGKYIMGLAAGSTYQKGNVLTTLKYSVYEVKYWIDLTLESLKMLFKGQVGVKEMSGPVGVVNVIGETYTESAKISMFAVIVNMMNIAILLSANLGVMNLLPIPALDGGRLVFLVIEAIRGKRVNPEREGMVHFIGLMALMVLMVVVLYNDVMRLL